MAHVCVRRRGRPAGTGHRPGVVEARTRNDNLTTEDTEDRRLKNSKFRIWNLEFGILGMWTWFHEFRIPNSEFQIRLLRVLSVLRGRPLEGSRNDHFEESDTPAHRLTRPRVDAGVAAVRQHGARTLGA